MAGLDKLYIHSYEELMELKKWATIYYPKLFMYFYDWALVVTEKDFLKMLNRRAKECQRAYKNDWDRVSTDGTINCAVAYIMKEWDWDDEQEATEEAENMKINANKSLSEIRADITFPILNLPFKVDKKLKWICPLPCIRTYLQTHCGIKEKWYYKLFWKGKEYFNYYF